MKKTQTFFNFITPQNFQANLPTMQQALISHRRAYANAKG